MERFLGIIGGSGLYQMEGLEKVEKVRVSTPFGDPSDEIITGELEGTRMAFLPRHGVGHRISPSQINYRANIFALKTLGVDAIVSVSAVGSMKEEIEPGHIVVPYQFIDRTKGRPSTFFSDGVVAHAQFADPVCPSLSHLLAEAVSSQGVTVHRGGTYLCMEGPQFSTRAESLLYRGWGVDVIGMTNIPEAKLAREAELCYATIALATDYDCWHEAEEDVSVEAILEIIRTNVENSKGVIARVAASLSSQQPCGCGEAMRYAIVTDPAAIPEEKKRELAPIIGKYL